jgi:hypothetical protein
MAVLKKHLTPIGNKGKIIKHIGKGATEQALPNAAGGGFSNTANDYSQATPMANPTSDTPDTTGFP